MVMGNAENMKSGSWPVVIHSPYVVEALRYILCLELRTCKNITQPAFLKTMDDIIIMRN